MSYAVARRELCGSRGLIVVKDLTLLTNTLCQPQTLATESPSSRYHLSLVAAREALTARLRHEGKPEQVVRQLRGVHSRQNR